MTKRKKQVKSNLTNALLYIIIGLLFCVFKAGMMNVLFSVVGALLIAISVVLTTIAGLIPARSAAKKDPVVALRTE